MATSGRPVAGALGEPRWHGEDLVRAAFMADSARAGAEPAGARIRMHPYPGIEDLFPARSRMQRAVADLCGLRATDADTRPWLRHAAWPERFHPLIDAAAPPAPATAAARDYPFVTVEGDGVHEIPVGPFMRESSSPAISAFLWSARRCLGSRSVWATCTRASNGASPICRCSTAIDWRRASPAIPPSPFPGPTARRSKAWLARTCRRARAWLRALALEFERLANHLGDLGAIGNDAGFAFGLGAVLPAQGAAAARHRTSPGQRYLMDFVVPGGTRVDLRADQAPSLAQCVNAVRLEVDVLRAIYDEHAGLRDRFTGAGVVTPALAVKLGLTGLGGPRERPGVRSALRPAV